MVFPSFVYSKAEAVDDLQLVHYSPLKSDGFIKVSPNVKSKRNFKEKFSAMYRNLSILSIKIPKYKCKTIPSRREPSYPDVWTRDSSLCTGKGEHCGK